MDPDMAAIDAGESAGSGASTPTTPDPQSPLIKAGNNRFNVQFVEVPEHRPSVAPDPETSRHDNSHTHNDTAHRAQSTFNYQVFDTLDFGPKTAFYRRDTQEGGTARPTMEELRRGTRKEREKVDTPKIVTEKSSGSLKLGWIQGVLMRCLLNIWGVMLFIRISWVIGQAGIGAGIGIIMLSAVVTSLTTVSLAAICTNGEVKGGGAYYLISRSLGPEFGGAIGIIFSIANAIAVAMYVVGFAETLVQLLRDDNDIKITSSAVNDMRILGCCTLVLLFGVSMMGMAWESKAQFVLLILLVIAMVNFVVGTFINSEEKEGKGFFGYNVDIAKYNMAPHYTEGETFFTVFSVFFPAATGIMAGANISGDLADPSFAIPKGTLVAILMSTITYILFAVQAGSTTILSAPGNASLYSGYTPLANMSYDMSCPWLQTAGAEEAVQCPWGLRQNYQTMAMISGWPPLITIGIFAATLSSALASFVSAPKVFQAVCKDKLFPYIGWFAKGYGGNNEPWRGYVLTFFIAAAFICIAELNAIAPIITNFFLVSYALINYSCFEASMSNSPGWRPSFKYYNMWTSLAGAVLCAVVMFVVSWWTALITCCIIVVLYRYIDYKKPDVNWGSSKQALKYNRALQLILELGKLQYHVKNFRPQFLVLTGSPSSRPRLTSFISQVSKGNGVFMCGQVVHNKHRLDLHHFNESQWLISNKLKGFHMAVSAWTFREGVEKMLQQNGLGELSANTLIMGFKHNWMEQPVHAVEEYVNIIVDAFDHKYGVGILRAKDGFDVKNLPHDDVHTFSEEINLGDMRAGVNSATVSTAELAREAEDVMSDGEDLEKEVEDNAVDDNGIELDEIQEKRDEENVSPTSVSNIDQYRGFGAEKPKGTIDVYWLSDDGGLSILLPYLLSQSPYWTSTKMRVFFSGKNKKEMGYDKARMAALLSKFRIEFSSVEIVDGLLSPPIDSSVDAYVKFFPSEEFDEGGRPVLDAKTLQYIRIGELLRENSKLASNTELIVVTMPVPRHNTPPLQYMSWLETISSDLPPLLLLRGNQSDALTFYC